MSRKCPGSCIGRSGGKAARKFSSGSGRCDRCHRRGLLRFLECLMLDIESILRRSSSHSIVAARSAGEGEAGAGLDESERPNLTLTAHAALSKGYNGLVRVVDCLSLSVQNG